MDELFWGREHKDVTDWAERLTMAAEVRDLNADKIFKIAKLNLRGRARDWFRRLQPALVDWVELRTLILQKYGNVNDDDIRAKLNAIKQEPRERVQKYFERLDRLFQRGKITDAEQRRRFLARLRPEIRKLCVVRTFADIKELVGSASELERVLGELGETPFEPLKEEQEEGAAEASMGHQVVALNDTPINFFKGGVPNSVPLSFSTLHRECQICKGKDHIATTCPRFYEPRPKCAKCGMPHRTDNYGVKCSFCSGLGHSEDMCWKKSKDGRSNSAAANFLEVMLDDEAATAEQLNRFCENENVFSYTRIPMQRQHVELTSTGAGPSAKVAKDGTVTNREHSVRSKILSHFIKGKISLTPMEIVMMIPGELEKLENLVKVARRKKDVEIEGAQVSLVSAAPAVRRICVNRTHRNKTLHLSVEINSCLIEGLVDTGASMNPVGAVENDDEFGREIQDLTLEPKDSSEATKGMFSVQHGRESEWLGLGRQVDGLRQHHGCCFGINHWRWSGVHQLCMLELLTDTSQGEEDELLEDGDEFTVGRETRRLASPESRQGLGRGKTKYYDRKQQLELVLAAQRLMEDVGLETHVARSEGEEACADGTSNTDVWEDAVCIKLLKEGFISNTVDPQESRRARKRAVHYSWKDGKLYFKGLSVPRPKERKKIVWSSGKHEVLTLHDSDR
ncbi:unnamed protein product [Sphagnum troendelagicum]|uniref:Retrotransposon gag domain-containing protein n=1 Tax=Sphagnum troendelagicum TaxID=128251 RepID=A0ABP0UN63_9BRYO